MAEYYKGPAFEPYFQERKRVKEFAKEDGINQSEVWRRAYEQYFFKNVRREVVLADLRWNNEYKSHRTKASEYATVVEEMVNSGVDFDIACCYIFKYSEADRTPKYKGGILKIVKNCKNYDKERVLRCIDRVFELSVDYGSIENVSFCIEFMCTAVHYYKIAENRKLIELEECCFNGNLTKAERESYNVDGWRLQRNMRQYVNCRAEGRSIEEIGAYLLCYNYPWWEEEHKRTEGAYEILQLEISSSKIDKELEEAFQEAYAKARVFGRLSKKQAYNRAFRRVFVKSGRVCGYLESFKTPN